MYYNMLELFDFIHKSSKVIFNPAFYLTKPMTILTHMISSIYILKQNKKAEP